MSAAAAGAAAAWPAPDDGDGDGGDGTAARLACFKELYQRVSRKDVHAAAGADVYGVYGEFTPSVYVKFARVWDRHGIGAPDATFCHLGTGVGKGVFAAAALTECPRITGIEWNRFAVHQLLLAASALGQTEIAVAHGSYMDNEYAHAHGKPYVALPAGTTHVYAFDETHHVRSLDDFKRARAAKPDMCFTADALNACPTWRVLHTFIPPQMWAAAGLVDFEAVHELELSSGNYMSGSGKQYKSYLLRHTHPQPVALPHAPLAAPFYTAPQYLALAPPPELRDGIRTRQRSGKIKSKTTQAARDV
jgi:hypothetical protein